MYPFWTVTLALTTNVPTVYSGQVMFRFAPVSMGVVNPDVHGEVILYDHLTFTTLPTTGAPTS